ncbi:unnamed protein product [Effrenium voratum]|nr:unnamed protein product [Effrenium voratum]
MSELERCVALAPCALPSAIPKKEGGLGEAHRQALKGFLQQVTDHPRGFQQFIRLIRGPEEEAPAPPPLASVSRTEIEQFRAARDCPLLRRLPRRVVTI